MKYKIGDKVIYIGIPNNKHSWELNMLETYEIEKVIFDTGLNTNDNYNIYYSVIHKDNIVTCWYLEENFISIVKARKIKLEKINAKRY